MVPNKVIVVSTFSEDEGLIENYKQRGIYGFIAKKDLKPDLSDLAGAIRYVHQTGQFFESKPPKKKSLKYSSREIDLIKPILEGSSTKEVASLLQVGEKVVSKHRDNLRVKTKTKNAAGFIIYALENGLKFLSRVSGSQK